MMNTSRVWPTKLLFDTFHGIALGLEDIVETEPERVGLGLAIRLVGICFGFGQEVLEGVWFVDDLSAATAGDTR